VPVSFANGGILLKGFVYRPKNSTRDLPLIALAHGSEESDRYSFGPIPLVLASRGFAVLAYDKRGTGLSSGDWKSVGLEEYADDLVAGIRASIAGGGIDTSRIAVLGLSEGGWVAPLASSRFPTISAIAAISGGARTKGDAYVHKVRRASEASGASPAGVDSTARVAQQFVQAATERVRLGKSPTGLDRRLAYDPTKHWRQFKGPILYMGGEADVLESGPLAADWFRQVSVETGNPDVTIRLWPRTHHSLILGVTGEPSEFQTFRGIKQLAPGYWDVLIGWLDRYVRALASTPTPQGG
jgi:pimeloyl-ACP methyl ester carboxylesterase